MSLVNICFMDCEANGLDPTEIHCVSVQSDEMDEPILLDPTSFEAWVDKNKPKKWVIHNGLGYDVWVINKLIRKGLINPMDVVDTLVVSKLVNYNKFQTHSLKELGEHLGVYKGDYTGGWDEFNKEMGLYCIQDVVVLKAIFEMYKKEIFDPKWSRAMRLEHDTALISYDMHMNGFYFDKVPAEGMLEEVLNEMKEIEDELQVAFPPSLVEVNRIKYRKKKDGSLYSNVERALEEYPMTTIINDELACFQYVPFSPMSPKQRVDKLWEAGWKPTEMTKGHKKFLRDTQRKGSQQWHRKGR